MYGEIFTAAQVAALTELHFLERAELKRQLEEKQRTLERVQGDLRRAMRAQEKDD